MLGWAKCDAARFRLNLETDFLGSQRIPRRIISNVDTIQQLIPKFWLKINSQNEFHLFINFINAFQDIVTIILKFDAVVHKYNCSGEVIVIKKLRFNTFHEIHLSAKN